MSRASEGSASGVDVLRPADRAQLAAALDEIGHLGPFFTVGRGTPPGTGWLPVRALYEDVDTLTALTARVARALATGETRVAASILVQGYTARLWSVGLAAVVRHNALPDLGPDVLLWRDHRGSVSLHLAVVRGWRGDGLDEVLARDLVERHLSPLVAAVRRVCSVSDLLLWDDVASALLGAARILDGEPHGCARRVAERVWGLARVPDDASGLFRTGRRGTCCLYYRVPGGGLCGDCVFTTAPSVSRRRR